MAQLGQQPGPQPSVNMGNVPDENPNAPLNQPPGSSDVWRLPPVLPDQPTIQDLKLSLEFAHSNINLLQDQLKANAEFQKQQATSIDKLQDAYSELMDYTSDLEEYVLYLDINSRKKNLIVTGVNEVPNENTTTLIIRLYNFFSQYVDTLEREDFDTANRIGTKFHGKKTRSTPIVVKFFRESTRNQISQIRFDLNDALGNNKIYVNDDLPKVVNDRRSLMRIVVKSAKEMNIPAKTAGNKVTVNNLTYSFRNLDCLPKGLKPEDLMMKDIRGHLYFSSEHAWLSNFYLTTITLQEWRS